MGCLVSSAGLELAALQAGVRGINSSWPVSCHNHPSRVPQVFTGGIVGASPRDLGEVAQAGYRGVDPANFDEHFACRLLRTLGRILAIPTVLSPAPHRIVEEPPLQLACVHGLELIVF